ncbi:MAG: protease HtpX [Enterobacteriaceae bacterium PSpicST2]|nr:MAG: protease HtpX [Enterobacteriaceae bacterium PSpicST2]WMC19047.1 MAG: protease HtpX [Enterobacteriaceae bacterium PSpicST1]
MSRILLLTLTNLLVVVIFGFLLKLLGLKDNVNQISLFIMIIFGFAGSIISILLSKLIILNSINGKIIIKPINKNEIWIMKTILNISKKKKIKMPEVIIYKSNDINAFATGPCSNNSLIGLSSNLIKYMKKNEIEAVIAHEISHISNGDMVTMGLLQGIMNTFILFLSQIITSLICNQEKKNNQKFNFLQNIKTTIFTSLEIILGSLSNIIIMGFSRYREFRADADAAKLVGKNNMILALNRLKISYKTINNSNMITFYINGGKLNVLNNIFNSHPSLDDRIKALINFKN